MTNTNHTAAQPLDLDKQRELFEAHFGPKDSFAWRNTDGSYKIQSLQSAWEIWQAALIAQARTARLDTTASASGDERALFERLVKGTDVNLERGFGDEYRWMNTAKMFSGFKLGRATLAPVAAQQAAAAPIKQYIGGRMVHFVVAPAGAKVTFGPDENTVHVEFAQQAAAKAPAAQADDLRLAICDIPLPVYGSDSFQHGFVSCKEAVLDLLSKRAASPASTLETSQQADDEWDRNAERLTREMGIGGGRINPDATSIDDLFIDDEEPQQAAAVAAPSDTKQSALGWIVRERRDADGVLRGCFVEAPPENGMAYGLEVLGDDYTGFGDIERKLEHCKMIVAWANAAPTAVAAKTSEDVRDAARYKWFRKFGYQAHELVFHDDGTLKWTSDLDEAIDAAIRATQQEGGK